MSAGRWIAPLAGVGFIAWAARSEEKLRQGWGQNRGRRDSRYAQRYIVYGGYGEPLGILNYGGRRYYSDEPPWETPVDLAESLYRSKGKAKITLKPIEAVSDGTFEKAQHNERSGKYRRHGLANRGRKHNKRVSKCISGKVRGEGWDERQAVAACLNMDREERLRSDGTYRSVKGRRAAGDVEILRSSHFEPWGKVMVVFDKKDKQYRVESRFSNFYRSHKGLRPNTPKARAALDRAIARFEEFSEVGGYSGWEFGRGRRAPEWSRKIKERMNELLKAKGKDVWFYGGLADHYDKDNKRKIKNIRMQYGGAIELRLDRPLPGRHTPLFTVTPDNSYHVVLAPRGRRAKRTTIATVNRSLRELGIPGKLVRGDGYYYMIDLDEEPEIFWAVNSGGDSIYVYSISDWSVDEVVGYIEMLGGSSLAAYRKRQGHSARGRRARSRR